LRHAPRGAGIGGGQRFDHAIERHDVGGTAIERDRHEHPWDASIVDRGNYIIGNPSVAFGPICGGGYDRRKTARPRHPIDGPDICMHRVASAD
jgi:hypothetical protein